MDLVWLSRDYLVVEILHDASLQDHLHDVLQGLLAVVVRDPVVELAGLDVQQKQLGRAGRALLQAKTFLVNADSIEYLDFHGLLGVFLEECLVEVASLEAGVGLEELQDLGDAVLGVEQLVDVRVEREQSSLPVCTRLGS